MKKYVTVIVILIIVILAHIFFISPLISSKPEEGAQTIMKPVEPVRETYRTASENPNFGKFFDYRKAVWGNKLSVKGSKQAHSGILVDLDTHKVLWAKNPRAGVAIASMTKMMTLLLAFEALDKRSDLDLDTPIKVSPGAAGMGGSQVYLDVKETHPFGELLKTMAIKSANDSAYLVAEYLGGNSMAHFITAMNKRAYKLRMPNTNFVNVHGLTSDDKTNSTSSPEGLAILAEHLLQYPLLIKWTSTKHAYFRPEGSKSCQFLTNTNSSLLKCPGIDGIKTGYTKAAGYCVTASCLRGGKRLVAVVTGFKYGKNRRAFVDKLFDWGYKQALEIENLAKKK
ncbi:MAG: D-alanyl-D-alanine carboxypeptidase [Victivallaceae bacterium]|nr:D-alanyl-D-alanine carboxypeptidase [Victivallaceae bacterium]